MSAERRPKGVELILRAVVLIILLSLSCAIDPVTGEREFMLVSEDKEIALGREAAPHNDIGKYSRERLYILRSLGTILRHILTNIVKPPIFRIMEVSLSSPSLLPGSLKRFKNRGRIHNSVPP